MNLTLYILFRVLLIKPFYSRRVQNWEEKLKVVSFLLTLVLLGSGVFWVVFGDEWYGLIHPGEKYFLLPSSVACPPDELFFTLS